MTFSQYAGVAIVPTLARIVLAAVFIPAGWNKVFESAEFNADQATRLRALGVSVEPVTDKTASAVRSQSGEVLDDVGGRFMLARYSPQDPGAAEGDPQPPAANPGETVPVQPSTPSTAPTIIDPNPAPATTEPLPPGKYKAQALHGITLMLDSNNFPYPVWQARLAAFTELIGGAMLLLGLFSRIWGLGLAIAMGVAFYLVSMKTNGIFTMDPRIFATEPMRSSTAFVQLSLFVLAFGVFLTGAGPLSLDRMLFGRGPNADPGDGKID